MRYSFNFCLISICLMVSSSNIPKVYRFSLLWALYIFILFGGFIWSVMCRFPLFITSMAHFSMSDSIPMSWLYILTARFRVFNSFPFLANSLMSSMYIMPLILSCDLQSFYPAVNFLSMWLSGIIARVMTIMHLIEIYLSGSLNQLSFSFHSPGFRGFCDKVWLQRSFSIF